MELFDYLQTGAVAVGLIVCMLTGKDTWMLADNVMWAGFGVSCYLFPRSIAMHLVSQERMIELKIMTRNNTPGTYKLYPI